MLWTVEEIVPGSPLTEPLSLADAKAQCEIEASETYWDSVIDVYRVAARKMVEKHSQRWLISRGAKQYLSCWPECDYIELRRNPVTAVASVVWTDADENATTLTVDDDYEVDLKAKPARINLPRSGSWPGGSLKRTNPICITFTAGYGATSPELTNHVLAIRLLVAHFFRHRGVTSEEAAKEVLLSYRSLIDLDRGFYFGGSR